MYRRRRNSFGGLSGGIVLLSIALAFVFGQGGFFLPIFFMGLAFSILVGALASGNPRSMYGAFYGFLWMIILAVFFITHWWVVFLLGAAISAILGALARPLLASLLGIGIFGAANMANQQPQQPYYQPPQGPYQQQAEQQYQTYQEGYRPPSEPTSQEGEQQYQYPPQEPQYQQPQYERPQAQYPQELPPQQQ